MHSLSGGKLPWVTKLSSAGLVYFHFGRRIIATIAGMTLHVLNILCVKLPVPSCQPSHLLATSPSPSFHFHLTVLPIPSYFLPPTCLPSPHPVSDSLHLSLLPSPPPPPPPPPHTHTHTHTDTPLDSDAIDVLFHKVYENFVEEIDAIDNGIETSDGPMRCVHYRNLVG